jgi:hypothetical protein
MSLLPRKSERYRTRNLVFTESDYEMTQNKINVILPHSAKAWATLLEIALAYRKLYGEKVHINLVDACALENAYPISYRRRAIQKKIAHENNFNVFRARVQPLDLLGFLLQSNMDFRKVRSGDIFSLCIKGIQVGHILHCRIAAAMGSRQYNSWQVPFKVFLKHYFVTYTSTRTAIRFLRSEPAPVVAYNGREPLAASFINIALGNRLKVVLAERGPTSSKYQIFPNSPHFHPDWWKLIQDKFGERDELSNEEIEEIEKYIENKLRGRDSYFDEDWGRKFIPQKSKVEFSSLSQGYVCYFSSSTTEFSPFNEYNSQLGYVNQFEAVRDLAEACMERNTQLVIRRHPNSIGKDGIDRESSLWELLIKDFSNIVYLSPFDTYNSYDLARGARAVMVWKSSIGFETLCLKKPTYALGPAKWAMNDEVRVWDRDQIERALDSTEQNCGELISAYSLFMTQSGTSYTFFKNSNKWGVTLPSGKKIYNTLFERSRRKLLLILSK